MEAGTASFEWREHRCQVFHEQVGEQLRSKTLPLPWFCRSRDGGSPVPTDGIPTSQHALWVPWGPHFHVHISSEPAPAWPPVLPLHTATSEQPLTRAPSSPLYSISNLYKVPFHLEKKTKMKSS